jgi:hypothetical protein
VKLAGLRKARSAIKAWFTRSKIRLRNWFLQLLLRIVNAGWFQEKAFLPVFRKIAPILLIWILWLFIKRLPQDESNPQIIELTEQVQQLKALWNSRGEAGSSTETGWAFIQTITLGTAGVGFVILTAIVIDHKISPAIWVATICFVLAVPILVAFGMVYWLLASPKQVPPTVREAVILTISLYGALLIFYVGVAAFLWSFDPRITAIFIIGSFLAWRFFIWFSVKLLRASQPPQKID